MPRLIVETKKEPGGAFEAFLDERNMSFFELSRKSGISEETLRRIKRHQSIRKATVRKLQKYFRVEKGTILDLLRQDGVSVQ